MLIRWLCILLVLSSLQGFAQTAAERNTTKWVVAQSSRLLVNGSTNINQFSCGISNYAKTDTLLLVQGETIMLLSGQVNLEVADFDCKNRLMTRELKQTLKSDTFPLLKISFISLKCMLTGSPRVAEGWIAIELSGVKKRYQVSYSIHTENGVVELCGTKEIRFSDFNLSPPKKMGNLVKAKDELVVIFALRLTKS